MATEAEREQTPLGWPAYALALAALAVLIALGTWQVQRLGWKEDLLATIEREMEGFRLYNVVPEVVKFIDSLTNWYIRRSRRRFWKSTDDGDKVAAYATLHRVLKDFAVVLAPYMPFVAEEMWQILVAEIDPSAPRSVHHADMPKPDESLKDEVGIRRTHLARAIVELGRSLRSANDLKVRQPLATLTVVPRSDESEADILAMKDVILEELNVKALAVDREESHLVSLSARPNFKTLGKRLGPALKTVGDALKTLSQDDLRQAADGKTISVAGHELSPEDLLIDRATKGDLVVLAAPQATVALDPKITPELRRECMARELQARIQARRKDMDLSVTDRVAVVVKADSDEVAQVVAEFGAALSEEVQADSLRFEKASTDDARIEGVSVGIEVAKA